MYRFGDDRMPAAVDDDFGGVFGVVVLHGFDVFAVVDVAVE